mmetsp:Transcript_6829/g.17163  ORF Transcript_6829/g.17163 Transcript_6829/m.17163 type:complete len:80 (-) Transcript_6829:69-308(-)
MIARENSLKMGLQKPDEHRVRKHKQARSGHHTSKADAHAEMSTEMIPKMMILVYYSVIKKPHHTDVKKAFDYGSPMHIR